MRKSRNGRFLVDRLSFSLGSKLRGRESFQEGHLRIGKASPEEMR
jgi:hypothetical protein